jgi:hypothetical protein
VNSSDDEVADVPPGVWTVTSTVPAEPEGEVTVNDVGLLEVTDAEAPPNATVDPDVNPEPLITTDVPPANGPSDGLIPVTEGTAS